MASMPTMTLTDDFVHATYEALNCPRSLTCLLLYKSGEHRQLAELKWDPRHYNDVVSARDSLAATSLLSKSTFLTTNIDKEAVALQKFQQSEDECQRTNRRLTRCLANPVGHLREVTLLSRAAQIAQKIVRFGRPVGSPDIGADDFVDSCDWGPGASLTLTRRQANKPNKYDFSCRATTLAYDFVVASGLHKAAYPLWELHADVRPGASAKIVTVPKNAKTDRVIAIEPDLNLWYQKGLGAYLRKALRHSGVDLDHQEHNQKRARLGSRHGTLATVDFSSASDTIASKLVEVLLEGTDWYRLAWIFRSSSVLIGGKDRSLWKFSSMGNGFTFELESLIFYSLAVAVCESNGLPAKGVSVYGDDVVIPSRIYDQYQSLCEFCGFTINASKSYNETPYRESCGEHYWDGYDIRPYYLKEVIYGKAAIFKAANSIRRLAHRRSYFGCDSALRRAWSVLRESLGRTAPVISEGYGDNGFIGNLDEAVALPASSRSKTPGWEGWVVTVYSPSPVEKYGESVGLLLSKLNDLGPNLQMEGIWNATPYADILSDIGMCRAFGNQIALSGRTRMTRKRLLIPRWYDLGPWV